MMFQRYYGPTKPMVEKGIPPSDRSLTVRTRAMPMPIREWVWHFCCVCGAASFRPHWPLHALLLTARIETVREIQSWLTLGPCTLSSVLGFVK